jgi:hypothetical protein
MTKGHKPAGGIRSKTVVSKPVRTGAARRHIQKAGVAQLGQMQGSHATNKGDTGYRGVGLIGPRHPISEPLGNEVSARTVCGPGGSREVMKTGSQGLQGAPNQGQPMRPTKPLWPGWEK